MADVSLLFQKSRVQIGSLEVDATLSEQHTADIEVTDHPVEQGANISDHARPKPKTLTLDGMVTNTPLGEDENPAALSDAADTLRSMKDLGQLITVVTPLETYTNMVITSLSFPRDIGNGQALRFSIAFKQVVVVNNRTVILGTKKANGQPKKDLGDKPSPPTPEANKSWLAEGSDEVLPKIKSILK